MSVLGIVLSILVAAIEPTPAAPILVQVSLLDRSGAVLPAAGAALRIERMKMPRPGSGDEPELVQAWLGVAGSDGSARFEGVSPPGMAESDRLVARWQGAETIQALDAPGSKTVNVVVREVSREVQALAISLRLGLTPRDSGLQVEHHLRIENPTHMLIDTDHGDGLVLPLLAPAPYGEPVTSFLPQRPEPRELLMQQDPERGRLLVEKGRLVFRGLVPPEGQAIRIIYVIPYAGETEHTYGLRMPVQARAVTLVSRSPNELAPKITFRAASEAFTRAVGGGEEKTAFLLDKPQMGEVVLIDVQGTPERLSLVRPLAAGLGAAALALLIVLAAGYKRGS